jgi:exonuclease SbcC
VRPRTLKLKGFTAFREEQVLDFTDLDLFALWGPTGSGKSSVLDAITYALYGKAERVEGARDVPLTELISQGQKRMAVTLEFEIGNKHLQITRSTPRVGNSTARLEIHEGGEWRTFGPGADRVRDVNRMLIDQIGLDYDAFTRSVILPQGKFAEFLVGDARKRREILTELLGLELFEKMGARANQISKDARLHVEAKQQVLEEQFAEITPAAVEHARAVATAAAERAEGAGEVEKEIAMVARRAHEIDRSTAALDRCERMAAETARDFSESVGKLKRDLDVLADAKNRIETARVDAEKAADALAGAEAELKRTEKTWGTRDVLFARNEMLSRLSTARDERRRAETALREATLASKTAAESVARREQEAAQAAGLAELAASALGEARRAHAEAHRGHLVAALVQDLSAGDPCPVCGSELATLPDVDRAAIDAATNLVTSSEEAKAKADAAAGDARTALAVARKSLEAAHQEERRGAAEAARWKEATAELEQGVAAAFGGSLPKDPAAVIQTRLRDLDELAAAVRETRDVHAAATEEVRRCERADTEARGEVAKVRAAIEAARLDRLLQDSAAASPDLAYPELPSGPWPEEPGELLASAATAAAALGALEERLGAEFERLGRERTGLLQAAIARLPEDMRVEIESVEDALDAARVLHRRTAEEAGRLDAAATGMKAQLDKRRELEAAVASGKKEQDVYRTLANELRRDRIVDYLQAEALAALAAGGSARLRELSGDRYRLSFEDDRFFVVDAWNGEERRSVRTLSGGETFVASLALALALADQVQLLAVTERQRLESLFLDEGFGSLDAEALEVVVAAIEQLGGEDRLVGVITHVNELAERMPTRIEIEKSPRGSRIVRAPAAPGV